MIKLRNGAFETNSSSMHCLILTGGRTYTPPDYEDAAEKNLISGKLIPMRLQTRLLIGEISMIARSSLMQSRQKQRSMD